MGESVMSDEIKLYGSEEVKEKVLSSIRNTLGELVTDEEIGAVVAKAKKDFLDELYEDSKKTLKDVYFEQIKKELEKQFIEQDFDEETGRFISKKLKELLASVGTTPISINVEAAAKQTINYFIDQLNMMNNNAGIYNNHIQHIM